MKWRDSRVVASDMGLVRDGFAVKHRYALDDLEEERVGARTRTARRATLGCGPIGHC